MYSGKKSWNNNQSQIWKSHKKYKVNLTFNLTESHRLERNIKCFLKFSKLSILKQKKCIQVQNLEIIINLGYGNLI